MARRVGCNRNGAGGMDFFPTHGGRFAVNVVGGGVLDAPRRGQDPSLRCKDTWAVMERLRAGHARPLRGGVDGLRTRGAREGGSPPPFPVDRWRRKARRNPSGLASSASSPDGEPFARAKPAREASPSGEVAAKQAGGVRGLAGGCPLMGYYGRLRAAYMPPLQSCRSPLRGFGGTPEF